MKRKNFDASSYTRYIRERTNTKMYQNDITSGISQSERKSIVSRSPATDLLKNGFLNEFSLPSVSTVPSVETIITIVSQESNITVDMEDNFNYTLSTNQNDTITVRLYDNGTTNTPINENANEVGADSPVYQITPSENITGTIPTTGAAGHYYFIRITPDNGPVVTSNLYLAIS